MTDLQAAIGVQQLKRLDQLTEARRRNHERLRTRLAPCAPHVRLQEPTAGADPSWFALLRVSPRAPFTRDELVAELERRRVQTRMLFAGNMVRQPAFDEMRAAGTGFRVGGALTGTDDVTRNAVVVGCYPGLGDVEMDYIADVVTAVVRTGR